LTAKISYTTHANFLIGRMFQRGITCEMVENTINKINKIIKKTYIQDKEQGYTLVVEPKPTKKKRSEIKVITVITGKGAINISTGADIRIVS
jgi:hypothetical protein